MNARTLPIALVAGGLLAAVAVGTALAATSGGHAAAPVGPLSAARYSLTIDGKEIASFASLQGLSSGADPLDFVQPGGAVATTAHLPANRRPPSIVLQRGMTNSLDIAAWHQAVLVGSASARKSGTLVMYDTGGKPVARYHLENAWPSKLEVNGLRSGASEQLMETVTLVCDAIQRVSV